MGSHQLVSTTLWGATPVLVIIAATVAHGVGPPAPAPGPGAVHQTGPPPGHTGGFGEPTCHACHSEFDVNPSPGMLGVDGFPATYRPGMRYSVSISLVGDEMELAGFQAAIRFVEGPNRGRSAGQFEPLDGTVTAVRIPDTGVEYLQHTKVGSEIVVNGVATWTAHWTAPHDTARVVLHVAANDANFDNSPLGDYVYTTNMVSTARTSDIRSR